MKKPNNHTARPAKAIKAATKKTERPRTRLLLDVSRTRRQMQRELHETTTKIKRR